MWFEITILIISTLSLFIQAITCLTIVSLTVFNDNDDNPPMTDEIKRMYS